MVSGDKASTGMNKSVQKIMALNCIVIDQNDGGGVGTLHLPKQLETCNVSIKLFLYVAWPFIFLFLLIWKDNLHIHKDSNNN